MEGKKAKWKLAAHKVRNDAHLHSQPGCGSRALIISRHWAQMKEI